MSSKSRRSAIPATLVIPPSSQGADRPNSSFRRPRKERTGHKNRTQNFRHAFCRKAPAGRFALKAELIFRSVFVACPLPSLPKLVTLADPLMPAAPVLPADPVIPAKAGRQQTIVLPCRLRTSGQAIKTELKISDMRFAASRPLAALLQSRTHFSLCFYGLSAVLPA